MLTAVVIGQACIHARMIEYIKICNQLINHCCMRRGCEQQYETWERPVAQEEFQVCSRYVMKIVPSDVDVLIWMLIFEPHAMFKIKNEHGDHVFNYYEFLETFYGTRIRALISV